MTLPASPGITEYSTPSDREVRMARRIAAPRTLVFRAWTEPALISKWLLGPEGWSMPVCEFDARAGGRWHYVWRKGDGTEMGMNGAIVEFVPPERMVTTERWGPEWPETLNTLVLTEAGGETMMTLTVLYPSREARDAALATGMKEGTEASFARLDACVAGLA